MRRLGLVFGILALAVFAVGFHGCGSTENTAGDAGSQGNGDEHADHGPHDGHGDQHQHAATGNTEMEKMKAELAKLSPEDAASAEKQHFCPVGGEMLGTMGPPQKVDVNGQQVWICCAGCEEELLANPDKHLAKLEKE